jgi:hypothetical protein
MPIGELETSLDPSFSRDADKNPGLIELLRKGSRELDFHCTVLGEGCHKGMLAVVDETVGREAPGVTALCSRDQEVAATLDRGNRLMCPPARRPRDRHH